MFEVFLEKRTHKGSQPIAEILFNSSKNVIQVETDDSSLITLLKGLSTRPMCQVTTHLGATTKEVTSNRFKEMLRYIRRPYFFSDRVERKWKHREVITL